MQYYSVFLVIVNSYSYDKLWIYEATRNDCDIWNFRPISIFFNLSRSGYQGLSRTKSVSYLNKTAYYLKINIMYLST